MFIFLSGESAKAAAKKVTSKNMHVRKSNPSSFKNLEGVYQGYIYNRHTDILASVKPKCRGVESLKLKK